MSVQSSPKWENLFPIIIVTNAESTSNNFLFKHIPHWAGSSLIFVTIKGRSPNPCSCLNFSMSSTSLLGSKHNVDVTRYNFDWIDKKLVSPLSYRWLVYWNYEPNRDIVTSYKLVSWHDNVTCYTGSYHVTWHPRLGNCIKGRMTTTYIVIMHSASSWFLDPWFLHGVTHNALNFLNFLSFMQLRVLKRWPFNFSIMCSS